jgi:dihydrofolate synthase/folylpolyglutamate synthase
MGKSGAKHTDLSRILALLDILGNPHKQIKPVHIAGTNGKGSTLAMASNAAIHAGYKTAQFTSPYVLFFEDRICINNEPISPEKLDSLARRVLSAAKKTAYKIEDFSQFECVFAVALLYFSQEQCDIAFIEAGIGGLLDATNVFDEKLVCAVTSIGADHTELLGRTLDDIATQKAGIFRACPCVIAENIAEKPRAVLLKAIETSGGTAIECSTLPEEYTVGMMGKHQRSNASVALEIISALNKRGFKISEEATQKSLLETSVGGRFQKVSDSPPVYFDGCHNVQAVEAFAETVRKGDFQRPYFGVIGISKGKDYRQMCGIFERLFDKIVCVDKFKNSVPEYELADWCSCVDLGGMTCMGGLVCAEMESREKGTIFLCGSLLTLPKYKEGCEQLEKLAEASGGKRVVFKFAGEEN